MIWAILEALANPEGWAASIKRQPYGCEITLEEIDTLTAKGIKVRG